MTIGYRILPTDIKGYLEGTFFQIRDIEILPVEDDQLSRNNAINRAVDSFNNDQQLVLYQNEFFTAADIPRIVTTIDQKASLKYEGSLYTDSMLTAETILKEKWKNLLEVFYKEQPTYLKMSKYFKSKNFEKGKTNFENKIYSYFETYISYYQQNEAPYSVELNMSYHHFNTPKLSVHLQNRRGLNCEILMDQITVDKLDIKPKMDGSILVKTVFLANGMDLETVMEDISPILEYFYSLVLEIPDKMNNIITKLEGGFNYSNIKFLYIE